MSKTLTLGRTRKSYYLYGIYLNRPEELRVVGQFTWQLNALFNTYNVKCSPKQPPSIDILLDHCLRGCATPFIETRLFTYGERPCIAPRTENYLDYRIALDQDESTLYVEVDDLTAADFETRLFLSQLNT